MKMRIGLLFCCACMLPEARAQDTHGDTKPERFLLKNGAMVLIAPYPDANVVAVETFYRTGFCDEPSGMIQAAHLLEHLLCQGATASYGQGESIAQLRKLGMANAETLPTLTHFDFTAPTGELETILKIEHERLTSLKITPDLISIEADKCDEETQYVYRSPQSGMIKHAFMALYQFWNHDVREVRVRSGLDQLPFEKLESFYKNYYQPDRLTVAIVGGVDKKDALKLAEQHLGSIPANKTVERKRDWTALPPTGQVTWDADLHAVCLYAPPPANSSAQRIASLWGMALMQKMATNAELRELTHMTFASNTTWPVGDLPFFLYATAKSPAQLPRIEQLLREVLQEAPKSLAGDLVQIRMFEGPGRDSPVPTWDEVKSQAASFAKTAGRSEEDTVSIILLNVALQWGVRQLGGAERPLGDVTEDRLREVLTSLLEPAALRVVTLGPPPSVDVGP